MYTEIYVGDHKSLRDFLNIELRSLGLLPSVFRVSDLHQNNSAKRKRTYLAHLNKITKKKGKMFVHSS